jgi:hypothetical protein
MQRGLLLRITMCVLVMLVTSCHSAPNDNSERIVNGPINWDKLPNFVENVIITSSESTFVSLSTGSRECEIALSHICRTYEANADFSRRSRVRSIIPKYTATIKLNDRTTIEIPLWKFPKKADEDFYEGLFKSAHIHVYEKTFHPFE